MPDKNNETIENWLLPEISDTSGEVVEGNTVFGKPATWYNTQDKDVQETEVEDEPQPLTLDDIEAIRQSAYEDGFNEGKEAGLIKGTEEGKLSGLAEGHKEGLEQGLQDGLEEGKSKIEEQVSTWQGLIERLHNPLDKLDDNAEYQLIRLATTLAEQITRCEVKTDPQIILQALKLAVSALPINEQKLTINLHPDDLTFVLDAYSQEQCLQRGWDLQAEPALMRGDCQIHTQVSSIDYAFNTRIEQVLASFFKENFETLPTKNDDSNLLNDEPLEEATLETEITQETEAPLNTEVQADSDE